MSSIIPADDRILKDDRVSARVGIVPLNVDEALTIAKSFAASGLFPDAKTAGAALAKIMAGAEYGVSPAQAMNSFHVVQGKIGMHYALIGSLVKRSGKYNFRVLEKSDERCSIEFFEYGESMGIETFTSTDAKRQGTQNMAKYPATMLYARCLTNGARTYCSEAFLGPIYSDDELRELEPVKPVDGQTKAQALTAAIMSAREARAPEVPADDVVTAEVINEPEYDPMADDAEPEGTLL